MIYVRFTPESRHTPYLNHGPTPASTCCARPRERDWYSIRLAVHSGATSTGRKTMTTPKAKFAGLALIAPAVLRVNLLEFEVVSQFDR